LLCAWCTEHIKQWKIKMNIKKTIIMLSVIAFAVVTQAASVDWKLNVASQGAAWKGAGAYVMAFNGSDYSSVIQLLTITGSEDMAADLSTYALTGNGSTQFAVGNNRGTATTSASSSTGVTGDTMFWVVFASGNAVDGSSIFWTAATDISAYDYEAGNPAPGTVAITAVPNSGTIAKYTAVPEPASAMLALAGVAMLIRRRK
jgi:hypothetical protein